MNDTTIDIVTKTFILVNKKMCITRQTSDEYGFIDEAVDNNCGDYTVKCGIYTLNLAQTHIYEDIYSIISTCALTEMHDFLYSLVPHSTNWIFSQNVGRIDLPIHVNTLPHVKMAIKYIENKIR
uniref:Uncharacterized protein n=1 Tax=viral metagenome TaxID=1070528 RepID=A0A6C0CCR4_9ZZZZ